MMISGEELSSSTHNLASEMKRFGVSGKLEKRVVLCDLRRKRSNWRL
jgi:hypothetical protein